MTEPKTIEVWIAIDGDGDYEVGCDDDDAVDRYNDNIGGTRSMRLVKLNVTMRPPEVTEASVTVPDEAGQTVEVAS
jgi:hypothetical protein